MNATQQDLLTGSTPTTRPSRPRPALALSLLLGIGLIVALTHLLVNVFGPYGIHRDEFLYLAMARHLKLWAMDFPPMIALLARATSRFLGDSIPAIRAVPAIAHLLLIVCAGMAARECGGGRYAQFLAALSVAVAPIFLRAASFYMPVILDQLWWTLALLALARIGRTMESDGGTGDPFAWLWLGVAAGLGLLTKFSIGFLGVGMLVGLLISPQRRVLFTRWPYEAVIIALIIGSASIVGQFNLHFPVIAQMQNLKTTQLERVSYFDFVAGQLLMIGPIVAIVAIGVARLLVAPAARGHRAVVWSCLATFLLLMLLHGKPYYIGPVYPFLIGAGAAAIELWTSAMAGRAVGRIGGNVLRGLVVALILITGLGVLPMSLPFLPPAAMARYSNALGITAAVITNHGAQLRIPQDYADMLGWPNEARAVSRAYQALPPDQQKQAVAWGANYGQAGALEYYAKQYPLPPVASAAGSFWFFGPGARAGNVLISIGEDSAGLAKNYRVVKPVWHVTNPWGVPEEQDLTVFVSEQPIKSLQQLWPSLKGRQ